MRVRWVVVVAVFIATNVDATPPFLEAAYASAQQALVMLECKDENAGCTGWAAGGECMKNPGFMHGTCRKSCDRCDLQAEDARHALEVITVAARNHHAACSWSYGLPAQCDGSEERLAATLAMAHEGARGKGLQRFIEALALEISASSRVPPSRAATFAPAVPTAEMGAGSVGRASVSEFVQLSDGGRMPAVGVGTWLTTGDACYQLVLSALRAGLRHIDTSENYMNHEEIGRAIKDSGVPRSDIFLADKLSFSESYSAEGVRTSVAAALRKMQTTYIDLYMLHSVGPSPSARHAAWREMIALQHEGSLRHLGVSNFGTSEMRELKAAFPDAPPVTLQSKFNPYHRGRTGNAGGEDFHTVSTELGITLTAYCPLNDWPSKLKAVDDVHIAAIARRLGRTPAQVILRWGLQLGMTMLTRSTQEERLRQATKLWDFEIGEADMALISGLAWFASSPTNAVPAKVVDTYGVAARDAAAYKHVPLGKAPVPEPVKACDMAWNMLGNGNGKLEL